MRYKPVLPHNLEELNALLVEFENSKVYQAVMGPDKNGGTFSFPDVIPSIRGEVTSVSLKEAIGIALGLHCIYGEETFIKNCETGVKIDPMQALAYLENYPIQRS